MENLKWEMGNEHNDSTATASTGWTSISHFPLSLLHRHHVVLRREGAQAAGKARCDARAQRVPLARVQRRAHGRQRALPRPGSLQPCARLRGREAALVVVAMDGAVDTPTTRGAQCCLPNFAGGFL